MAFFEDPTLLFITLLLSVVTYVIIFRTSARSRRASHRLAIHKHQKEGAFVGAVSRLNIYPIKSCSAVPVDTAELSATGLRFDRRFVLARRNQEEGGRLQMISQRELPKMALILPAVMVNEAGELTGLTVRFLDPDVEIDDLVFDLQALTGAREEIVIWPTKDPAENGRNALVLPQEVGAWFRQALQTDFDLFLGFMDESCTRLVNAGLSKATPAEQRCPNSFADVAQYLLLSEESIDDLCDRLPKGVNRIRLNRFRPNIVVSGVAAPWAEDTWKEIEIVPRNGENEEKPTRQNPVLHSIKMCARCVMPSTNQVSRWC